MLTLFKFYDLAWASTFSNLTQNSTISGGEESLSYAVFFSMVWWMWVSQVSYDIRVRISYCRFS